MNPRHPARNARHLAGAASVAAFVGAAIAIATNGHNGTTQPAGAATTPTTAPAAAQQPNSAYDQQGDDGWGATPPDQGFQFNGGDDGSFNNPPSHSRSGGS